MQVPNLTLTYQTLALKPVLEGAFLNKVQKLSDKAFKLRFHTKQGSKDLVFNGTALYLTSYKLEAQPSQGFAAYLKKQLYNKRVNSLYQQGVDRVLVMEFTDYHLVFELFADSNLILADKSWKTLSALSYGDWKDRAIRRNQPYQFPASKGLNPSFVNAAQLRQQLAGPDLVRALVSGANIAPQLAEEAIAFAGLQKTQALSSLSEAHWHTLAEALLSFYAKPSLDKLKPAYYADQQLLLPFPLSSVKGTPKAFTSLDEAFDTLFSAGEARPAPGKTVAAKPKAAKEKFLLEQQLKARQDFAQRALESQKKAEAIYTHYAALQEIFRAVKDAGAKGISDAEVLKKLQGAFKQGLTKVQAVEFNSRQRKLIVELK